MSSIDPKLLCKIAKHLTLATRDDQTPLQLYIRIPRIPNGPRTVNSSVRAPGRGGRIDAHVEGGSSRSPPAQPGRFLS